MYLHSYPEYVPFEVYQNNIKLYAAHLKEQKEIAGLYLMGSITAPGLSDIDLIVVVGGEIRPEALPSPLDLSLDRRLFLHDAFVLNVDLVRQFDYLFYATNIKPVFVRNGSVISFPLSESISQELRLIYLIELSKMRLDQFCAISRSGKCNVRKLITRVSSITHSVNLARELSVKLPNGVSAYRDEILALRTRWTERKGMPIEDVCGIFNEGLEMWCRLLEAASEKLAEYYVVPCNRGGPKKRFMNLRFSSHNDCHLVKDENGRCDQVLFPRDIYYHYEGYKKRGESKYRQVQGRRLKVIKQHRHFLMKMGIRRSMSGNLGVPVNQREELIAWFKRIKECITY